MGNIVSFAPRRAAKNRRGESSKSGAAVIIFPGVRYERQPEPAIRSTALARKEDQQNSGPLRH
jgi:hypothetical protein